MVQMWKRASMSIRVALILGAVLIAAVVCVGIGPVMALTEDRPVEPAPAPVIVDTTDDWDQRWAEIEAETKRRTEVLQKAEAERTSHFDAVRNGISKLQPWYSRAITDNEKRSRQRRRDDIANAIIRAAERYEIDPRIVVAVAYRESSIMPSVGTGKRNGSRGEMGYFQIMPNGYALSKCGSCGDQYDVQCNASTALCWMDHCRELCGNDPWLYLGGYGRRLCPRNREEAMTWTEVQRARSFLCEAYPDCDSIWPT